MNLAVTASCSAQDVGATGEQPDKAPYLLANSGGDSRARFAALSTLFDPTTIGHLTQCGVASGWRCLEVGAGGGSIATWLADRVAPTGVVLATDIDPRFLHPPARPNLEVQRHDISVDSLPESAFDLVHSRLVLLHVPQRHEAMARMVRALKPGGWIVAEEFDSVSMAPPASLCPSEVQLQTQVALLQLLEDHGVDRLYGRRLFGVLQSHGLVNLHAEGRVLLLQPGTAGASMLRANYQQLRDAMIGQGYITREQFDTDLERLQEPHFAMLSALMWSVRGQRSVTGE
jgi:SAM-dependent methyltransferase